MPKKTAAPENGLNEYELIDPSPVSSLAFQGAVYPVHNGKLILTHAQALPFLAEGQIRRKGPAPVETIQTSLELPAE